MFNLSPHPDHRLAAFGKTDPSAPVGGGQEIGLGAEGPKGGGAARVGADRGLEREGGVEIGELGGREEEGRTHYWLWFRGMVGRRGGGNGEREGLMEGTKWDAELRKSIAELTRWVGAHVIMAGNLWDNINSNTRSLGGDLTVLMVI
jgi:hypothetical protein